MHDGRNIVVTVETDDAGWFSEGTRYRIEPRLHGAVDALSQLLLESGEKEFRDGSLRAQIQ